MSSLVADKHPVVGRVRAADLHHSIFTTFARAVAEGVDVTRLDALKTLSASSPMMPVLVRSDIVQEHLEQKIKQARSSAERARRRSAETDGKASDRWAATAEDLDNDADRLQRELEAEIETAKGVPAGLPDIFDADVTLVLAVLRRLAVCEFQLTPAECDQVQDVLQLHGIKPVGDHFEWSASLLLPWDGAVLQVGPVSGVVAATGLRRVPTPPPLSKSQPAFASRVDLRYEALQLGVSSRGSRLLAVATSTLPDMPANLVAWLKHKDPDRLSHGWQDAAFMRLLEQVYTDPALRWNPGQWLRTSPKRQHLADLVAGCGGRLNGEEFKAAAEILGLVYTDLHHNTVPPKRARELPWVPSVQRESEWDKATPAADAVLVSWPCWQCGGWAAGVLRVPEVTGSLICRACAALPHVAGVVAPADYLGLVLPEHPRLRDAVDAVLNFRTRMREDPPPLAIVPGRWHSRYDDDTLVRLLAREAALISHPTDEQVVRAALGALGYERKGGAAAPRLLRLWQRRKAQELPPESTA